MSNFQQERSNAIRERVQLAAGGAERPALSLRPIRFPTLRPAAPLVNVLLLTLVSFSVIYLEELASLRREIVFPAVSVTSLLLLTYVVATNPRGLWSFSGTYLLTFWLFHFGLVAVVGLTVDSEPLVQTRRWMLGPFATQAAMMACVGVLSLGAGVGFASRRSKRLRSSGGPPAPDALTGFDRQVDRRFTSLGTLLVIASVASWFLIVLSSGGFTLRALTISYREYLDRTGPYPMEWIWFLFGIGVVLVATAAPSRIRNATWCVLLIFSIVALPMGLRGELMFPTLAAFAACAMRGQRLSPLPSVILLIAVLFSVSIIKNVRTLAARGASDRR